MSSKSSGPTSFGSKNSSTLKLNQGGSDWSEGNKELGSDHGESDSELSETESFLAKGAFLLTPSYELSMEKASSICEKMNFKSAFSITKTATGILFKFANPEDYQAVFKKGFHKVTGARFYKKIPIPCRPQKTFTIFVMEIPEDVPEEDIRHSLYKFNSVVEVCRLPSSNGESNRPLTNVSKNDSGQNPNESPQPTGPPPVVRITLASMEEANLLLQNGLDFYGATFFPTDTLTQTAIPKEAIKKVGRSGSKYVDLSSNVRVQDLLPVFDASGFQKIPPPAMKTVRPGSQEFGNKK